MYQVIFKAMLATSLKDKITLFYSLAFPLLLMIGLGYYFNESDQQLHIVAGVTAVSTIFWGMQGIAFQVHEQRNRGVYKLVKLTPMPLPIFICIMVLARTLIGVILNLIVWITGILLFQINVTALAFMAGLVLLIIGSLCFTSIGFVISNLARNEAQISMFSNLIQLPMIFMSSAFYSLKNAPEWVIFFGKMFPFEHYAKALRGLMVGESGSFLISFGIPIIYLVLALLLSILTFRWETSYEGKTGRHRKLTA